MRIFERANPSPRMRRSIARFNAAITTIIRWRVLAPLLGRRFADLAYIGPKSGKSYSFPVWATPMRDGVRVPIYLPEQKNWWRLFRGEGMAVRIRRGVETRVGWGVITREGWHAELTITWNAAVTEQTSATG